MRNDLIQATTLIDVKNIPRLRDLTFNEFDAVIGAAVPLYQLIEDRRIAETYPSLFDSIRNIGGAAIQSRATLGGNLCNAAPSGDSIPSLIALGARCLISGPGSNRVVPVEELCIGPGKTSLQKAELLTAIQISYPSRKSGSSYMRFIPRNEMDIAVVGVGASLTLSDDEKTITEARLALGAVAPQPLYVAAVGDALRGIAPTEEAWSTAEKISRAAAKPISDVRGTASLRTHLVGVFTKRALRLAYTRAKGG
jgi:carbon-monoxide dehydrogenase medium subunit